MARLSMLPDPSRAVSTDSWTHRRRDVLADETLAKDNHRERFHQGLGGQFIEKQADSTSGRSDSGKVACRSRLGGRLNFYYREAA
jgi:hypothetical protein